MSDERKRTLTFAELVEEVENAPDVPVTVGGLEWQAINRRMDELQAERDELRDALLAYYGWQYNGPGARRGDGSSRREVLPVWLGDKVRAALAFHTRPERTSDA